MSAKKTTLASKISVTSIILLSSLYSNASVNKLFLRLLSFLLTSFSIVLNSSVCNLCHLVSPKVVGGLEPFLQSAFASSCEDERNPFRVGLLASNDKRIAISLNFTSEIIYKIFLSIRSKSLIAEYLDSVSVPRFT